MKIVVISLLALLVAATTAKASDAPAGQPAAPSTSIQPNLDALPNLDAIPLGLDEGLYDTPKKDDGEEQMPCLCAKALGAATCKDDRGFNLMGKKGAAYIYSAFYGSDDTTFYCLVSEGRLVISAEPWGEKRLSATYKTEPDTACVKAEIGLSLCDTQRTVRCCRARAEAETEATASAAMQ